MVSKRLEKAAQNCGCLMPGIVQDQVGWGFEQPDLVRSIPAHGTGTRGSLMSFPTKIIQFWFNAGSWIIVYVMGPIDTSNTTDSLNVFD